MLKSKFDFEIVEAFGNQIIVITDLRGYSPVTSEIENVVNDICEELKSEQALYMVKYKENPGVWDMWDAAVKRFTMLTVKSDEEARWELFMYVIKHSPCI